MASVTVALVAQQQGLDPKDILKPLSDSWPTYSGDYSARRYSALKQINQANVKNLSLAWTTAVTAGPGTVAVAPPFGPAPPAVIEGGVGDNEFVGATTIKGAVLAVNGVLYVTAPDNVWALDALDGHLLWRFFWRTRGGTHIGNRGAAMWRNYLFFVTPDDYLISLDARTGKERWHKEIANFNQQYFLTSAPVVVDNHVIVGTGNDLDSPGYLQSFDPETGDVQWTFYSVPMKPGDPGLETWKDLDAARNGGGHPWLPGAYDPETRLYIFGTGNPTPAYTSAPRGVRRQPVHVRDRGGARRHRQDGLVLPDVAARHARLGLGADAGPRRRRDQRQPRKLVVTASRNGYYFTLDRTTGERLVTSQFSETVNWARGLNAKGQPVRDSREGSSRRRRARVVEQRRRHQLAAAGVQPGHGAALRADGRELRDVLPDRARSARRDGPRRQGRDVASAALAATSPPSTTRPARRSWKHRFQTAANDGPRQPGLADDGRPAALRRRRLRQLRRVRCGERQTTVACAHRQGHRTRRRRIWSMAASTCSSRPATVCIRLRCIEGPLVLTRDANLRAIDALSQPGAAVGAAARRRCLAYDSACRRIPSAS